MSILCVHVSLGPGLRAGRGHEHTLPYVFMTLGPGLRAGRGHEHTLPYVFVSTLCVFMSP